MNYWNNKWSNVNRIQIENEILKKIFADLQKRGYTLSSIINCIGESFRNALYHRCTMTEDSFIRLQNLYEKDIPHKIKISDSIYIQEKVNHDEDFAEFIGIMLGDGHINIVSYSNKIQHRVVITLNGVDEKEYVEYVKTLTFKIFGIMPKISKTKGKGIQLRIWNKSVADCLIANGLICGKKKENQVGVPQWIMSDIKYVYRVLKGLIDTDGCISIRDKKKAIQLSLSNRSVQLLNDFKAMCDQIGVHTSCITYNNVHIGSRSSVQTFLDLINPEKWKKKIQQNDSIQEYLKPMRIPKKVLIKKVHKLKFNISNELLEELVWEKPTEMIAKEYGVSGSYIAKYCKKWGINKPQRGYWSKKQ